MPTRIFAGVGEHPCFLTSYTMIPMDSKIYKIFPYSCLFAFFERSP